MAETSNWANQYVKETCDDILKLLSLGQAWPPKSSLILIIQSKPAPVNTQS